MAGVAGGLLLIGLDRAFGGLLPEGARVSWPYLLGLPAGLCAAAGLTVAVVRRWRADRAALEVDRVLGLKERLSTALALAAQPASEPGFEALAIREAELTAPSVRLSRAMPIRPEWTWGAWPIVAAGAVAIAVLVPRVQWREPVPAPVETIADMRAAEAEVRDAAQAAREAVQQSLADRGLMDVASTEQLKQLEDLERNLVSSRAGAGEARVRAAESLESLADQLQSKARDDQAAHEALQEQLGESEATADGLASALTQALQAGDMAAARDVAKDLLNGVGGMSETDRQALARDLEELAERLNPPSAPIDATPESNPTTPPPGAAPETKPPADVASETDPDRIRERLEQQGVPPDQSQRMADEIARKNRERQAREEARRDAEKLSENLRDSARQAREGQESKPPSSQADGNKHDSSKESGRSDPASSVGKPSDEKHGEGKPRDQGGKPESKPGDQSGTKPGAGDKPADQAEDGRESRDGKPTGESKPGDGSAPADQRPNTSAPGVKSPGAPATTEGSEGDKPRGEKGEGQAPSDKPGESPGDKPGDQPGDKSGETPSEQPGQGSNPEGQPQRGDKPDQPGNGQGKPSSKPGDQGTGSPKEGKGGSPEASPGAKPGDKPGTQPGPPGGDQPGDGRTPGVGPDGSSTSGKSSPDGQAGADQQGAKPTPGGGPGDAGGFGKLQEQLDQLAERQQNAKRAGRLSQDLRERAKQLLENASPEDRQAIERWARDQAKENPARPDAGAVAPRPWDGQTELVDARERPGHAPGERAPDPSEKVIAEWFSNQGVDRTGAAASPAMAEQFQQASEGAEKAIEQQSVPRRHSELIRRIFRRYTDRAEGKPPAPAVDAPDAEPAKKPGK